jgi:hypothetical protein
MMEPELHREPTQPFARRRCDARLDVRKYFEVSNSREFPSERRDCLNNVDTL